MVADDNNERKRGRLRSGLLRDLGQTYGSSEMIFVISASGHARTVRVRTLPIEAIARLNFRMFSGFAVSAMTNKSDSPVVRYILKSIPNFFASS
jgi:hypothetical protein